MEQAQLENVNKERHISSRPRRQAVPRVPAAATVGGEPVAAAAPVAVPVAAEGGEAVAAAVAVPPPPPAAWRITDGGDVFAAGRRVGNVRVWGDQNITATCSLHRSCKWPAPQPSSSIVCLPACGHTLTFKA